jgi:hypothetical protein
MMHYNCGGCSVSPLESAFALAFSLLYFFPRGNLASFGQERTTAIAAQSYLSSITIGGIHNSSF